ncbi:hypothetical protein BD324DRAFT_642887 [Kockovaella imperatae]|uniref:Frag1/DRAM/Sfk1 family-domain-containing protein n=1 Tax=Kockovaella imperatae TaxID=4999 RepID=A0A1Y1UCB0_9TREE|nr:hypothetical protein BD324DRAFT_642887 [Kockovaella imperatae]ORX35680.1 hypothetical protein BD324DRAFT_642887 [Kockovaella imperatae]
MTSLQDAEQIFGDFNFTGGFPTSKDLGPSILFAILYGLSAPVLIWRIFRKQDRTIIFVRLGLFWLCRMAALIMRAIMAKNTYGAQETAAEVCFVALGFLFLLDPFSDLWKRHVDSVVPISERPWVLKLALLAAVATAIASACMISGAVYDPAKVNSLKALRLSSYALALGVAGLVFVMLVVTHFLYKLDTRRSAYLFFIGACLVIVASYRVAQESSNNRNSPARSDVAFWVLQITFEL